MEDGSGFRGRGPDSSRKEAARFHDQLARLGFIETTRGDKRQWQTTAKGSALCMASAAPPITRARAEQMLQGLLDRVQQIIRDPQYLLRVTRLAVFGSYLSDATLLGDLDVLIELTRRIADADEHMRRSHEYSSEAARAGRRFSDHPDFLVWPETEIKQILRARQRISLHDWSQVDVLLSSGAVIRELPLGSSSSSGRSRGRRK